MEKININNSTDFYDNARSARNEKAQRRVGDVNKNDIDASGWKEPTMETERKTGGRPQPRAYKRGGSVVDGKADKPHAGRAKRASGGKLAKYVKAALKSRADLKESLDDHWDGPAGLQYVSKQALKKATNSYHNRKAGIDTALNKLTGEAKVPARASGGSVHPKNCTCKMCSGGKTMKRAAGGKTEAPPKRTTEKENVYQHEYNPHSVQKAINSSRKPISGREAKLIHSLLKGRTGRATGGKTEGNYEGGTRPDGGRIAKASGGKLLRYLEKALPDRAKKIEKRTSDYHKDVKKYGKDHEYGKSPESEKNNKQNAAIQKRANGINMAMSKLTGRAEGPSSGASTDWGMKKQKAKVKATFARGGKAKGKTNINIIIGQPKSEHQQPMAVPPPPGAMPPAALMKPPMPAGAPPPGLAVPPPAVGAGPMPMGRKSGGSVRSYKGMTAGAGGGEGRLEKAEIQKSK